MRDEVADVARRSSPLRSMISAAASAIPTTARLNTVFPSWRTKCSRASTVACVAGRSAPPDGM